MIVKLLAEHHLEFLSLKRGCRGSSESTLVKMSNCWKSHVTAHLWTAAGETGEAGLQIRVCIRNDSLISHPKHMLWVLKRTVSMRWFF